MWRSFSAARLTRWATLLALLALAMVNLSAARRADPGAGQERYDQLAGALDPSHSLAQTFTAGRDGLCAMDVFARIPPGKLDSRYSLTLRLSDAGTGAALTETRISLVDARAKQRITVAVPTQRQSRGKIYLLHVETNAPPDTVSLLASSEDAYPGGELLQDGQPTGRDLAFRTYTALEPFPMLGELAGDLPDLGLLLVFTALFGATGWAFLTLIHYWPDRGLAEKGLWSLGAGLALTPVIYLLAGKFTGIVLAGMGIAALITVAIRRWKARTVQPDQSAHPERNAAVDWGLPAIFLWALIIRVLQIRDIPAPMWMDGLSHIQMIQSILEAGRMPGGLLYHIGFHTQVALLSPLFSVPLPRLIVLFGQLISALGGPALYVLAKRIFRLAFPPDPSDARAQVAALLAALGLAAFPSLPGYLINWGRYPFLLGMALLPFALAASLDALQEMPARAPLPHYGLMIALVGGLFLSHYGMISFWLSFAIVFLAIRRPDWLRRVRWGQALAAGLALVILGLLAGYLRFGDNLTGKIAGTIAESRQMSDELNYAEIWQLNLRAGGTWLVAASLLAGLWAARTAPRLLLLTTGWFLAQAALVAAQSPVLGYALASYANLLLALPLPLAVLTGGLLEAILHPSQKRPAAKPRRDASRLAAPHPQTTGWVSLVAVFLALAGGWAQVGILNPAALLYSPADEQAMAWINANLPANTRFLINARNWTSTRVTPADGGGWLNTMTGRDTAALPNRTQGDSLSSFIEQEKVDYVYLGRFSGFLKRDFFEQAPDRYRRVYHQDGVDIYAVNDPVQSQ